MDIKSTAEGYLLEAFAKKAEASVGKGHAGDDGSKLKETCADFESILLNYMFQSMKKTVGDGGLFNDSFQKDMYETVFFEKISQTVAKERGIGLGEALFRQLSAKTGDVEAGNPETDPNPAEPVKPEGGR